MARANSKAALEEFGRRVRAAMKQADIVGPAELAARMNKVSGQKIGRAAAHRWVRGISMADERNIEILARALGVPVDTIKLFHVEPISHIGLPLENGRHPFEFTPDLHNPALGRAVLADTITAEQAERIRQIINPETPKKQT